ncbi:hypothetical protein KDH83_28555 [Achromobacter sp. Marseille-Q0513]|uniref:hypothetical protein n=1 Tax=Achromobacter sp. Marseille-Q0513 TaxID=2829161 RepID=UPI001B9883AF|nr:hypothetical protein [Achromobacter sp. Marseille-Q0513]MBR8657274.1 hypothetical protein [Achromobacter sp. Marseille-Q0513]
MPSRPTLFAPPKKQRAPRPNSLLWVLDPLERDPGYLRKKMFGCEAAYLDGLLCLVAADRGAPWGGLLVCTSQAHHAALIEEAPALRPHPVLGKWLYVPEADEDFEAVAELMARLALARDPRLGIAPKPRRREPGPRRSRP